MTDLTIEDFKKMFGNKEAYNFSLTTSHLLREAIIFMKKLGLLEDWIQFIENYELKLYAETLKSAVEDYLKKINKEL